LPVRGIGAAGGYKDGARQANVAVFDLTEAGRETVEAIEAAGAERIAIACDVEERGSGRVLQGQGSVSVDRHPHQQRGAVEDNLSFKMSDDDWDTVLDVREGQLLVLARGAKVWSSRSTAKIIMSRR